MKLLEMGEQLDPILLELGSCLVVCQGFEQTLVFLLAVVAMEEADMAEGSFDIATQKLSRETLGRLLGKLRNKIDLPDDIEGEFVSALKARNWVVHSFVHDSAFRMIRAEDRHDVLLKVASLKRIVMSADKVANTVLDQYLSQFHLTFCDLEANFVKVWESLHPENDE